MTANAETSDSDRHVIAIGAAGMDFVGRLDSDLQMRTSNPAQIQTYFGGVARNVSENLVRLGQPVILLSIVGNDPTGDQLIQHLNDVGVGTAYIMRSALHRTGAYLGVIDNDGGLAFALDDMRAAAGLTSAYLREHKELFKGASALFVDGNLPPKAMRTAFHLARLARIPVYADPTSTTLAHRLTPYLDQLRMIAPNSTEAAVFCEEPISPSDRQQAIRGAKLLVSKGVELAIITLAEFGVVYATSEVRGHIPALRTEISDPTGAGDALSAAVIYGLLSDFPPDDAVRLGISAASLTLRHPGTVVPDLSLEKLYDQLVI